MNYGKYTLRFVILAILTAVILSIAGWIFGAIKAQNMVWGTAIGILLAAVFFILTKKINPGKEEFMEYFPILLIVAGIMALLAAIFPNLPLAFVIDWSFTGVALAFGSVFLSTAITRKYLHIE